MDWVLCPIRINTLAFLSAQIIIKNFSHHRHLFLDEGPPSPSGLAGLVSNHRLSPMCGFNSWDLSLYDLDR